MVEFNLGNVGAALAGVQAPSASYTPQQLGFWDKLKTGMKDPTSLALALNTAGQIAGADKSLSSLAGGLIKSSRASEAAKKREASNAEWRSILARALAGSNPFEGSPTPEGAGGLTSIKVKPTKSGSSVVVEGDLTAPKKESFNIVPF